VKKDSAVPQNIQQKIMALLKIVEGISRSLNNLLERFHQSFFFYVIINSERFISIGDYMPSIGLMAGSLLIKSFLLWLTTNKPEEEEKKEEEEEKILIVKKSVRNIDVLKVGTVFMVVHLLGVFALFLTTNKHIHDYFFSLNIPTQSAIFYLISFTFALSLLAPKFLRLNFSDGQFLNTIVLLELGTMLLSVSMLNFSLGFFLCVVIVPFAIAMNIDGSSKKNLFAFLIKSFMHVLVHPLAMIYGVILTMSYTSFGEMNFNYILDKSFKATVDGITYSVVDSLVSQSNVN
jgi:GPI-anchor transamidase subunit GAA1